MDAETKVVRKGATRPPGSLAARVGATRSRRSGLRLGVLLVVELLLASSLQLSRRDPPSALPVSAFCAPAADGISSAVAIHPMRLGHHKAKPLVVGTSPRLAHPKVGPLKAGGTMLVKQFLHLHYRPVIWWQRWVGPIDLGRADMRVTGHDTYALVAAVLLQVLVGLYGVTKVPSEDDSKGRKIVFSVEIVLTSLAAICSAFTMLTFLLNKIYSTTALGVFKDVAYDVYQMATRPQRACAFWSLIIAMVTFLITFSLNLFLKLKGKRGYIATALTLVGSSFMLREWVTMMVMANKYIFRA